MNPSIPYTAVLICHPGTYSQAVHGIEARVCWTEADELSVSYALKGNFARLRIPPTRPVRRADRLWQHTCFEAFVSVKGNSAYYEFNFAPSCEWAAYSFRGYRDGMSLVDEELAPEITVRSAGDIVKVDAIVRVDRLPTIEARAVLRLGLSAVVEDDSDMLSYWALKHAPGMPDFHHPDAFALELEPPHIETANESAMGKR